MYQLTNSAVTLSKLTAWGIFYSYMLWVFFNAVMNLAVAHTINLN